MNLKTVKNTELVKLCAREPGNRDAWLEFYTRFDERIWLVIYRECMAKRITELDSQFQKTVQDLVQEVYVKLVANKCRALKNFIGESENSIYTYLGIIAKNVVTNYITKIKAQKRPSTEKYIDEVLSADKIIIKNVFQSAYPDVEEEFTVEILKEEIEHILNKILKGKDKERNKLIFKLHLYEGFSAEDIASKFGFDLSSKRIANLITEIKKKLRKKLLARMVEVY